MRPRSLIFTSPGKFLIQVRIEEPSLGEQWQGRLLTVYFTDCVLLAAPRIGGEEL
jgi:hypothetical protein